MKKLMWVDDTQFDKIKELDPDTVIVDVLPVDENAVLVTYLGRSLTPELFQKVARKYKLMLEESISALEQNTKRKFELIFAQDENHMKKLDTIEMARLGWHRIIKH